jgi:hypothetical protein
MVSKFESRFFIGGILSFYAFAAFDVIYKRMKKDKEAHKNLVKTAEKAIGDMNRSDLKFIETPNKKMLFILGFDNDIRDLERIKLIHDIFTNFTPGTVFLERNSKQYF